MSSTPLNTAPAGAGSSDRTLLASLALVEDLLELQVPHYGAVPDKFEALCAELRRLHAHLRTHHAADCLRDAESASSTISPELAGDRTRLTAEHSTIVGRLDRIIRSSCSAPDAVPDDLDVFVLRVRELLATVRRHVAEEDRLLHLALWHDVGGES